MNIISIDNKVFKRYKNTEYFCDEDGNIYSNLSQKLLSPLIKGENKKYKYIDINFGEGQKHVPIHKIVYETWLGEIPKNYCVLHKDDNSFNNNINNLYIGNQEQNIKDCINNNHRVGNTWILTVYDKEKKETITFCPAKDFIKYSNHSCANGGVKRMFSRNWFKKRYDIISYYLCKNLDIKKSVTTNPDECKDVE